MKAIIFAGGVGTRLWPVSRRKSPKQFEKVIGNKSTIQLAAERLLPQISWPDIYISTSSKYINAVRDQLPQIYAENIIGEPDMRDVGPAVGLVTAILSKRFIDTPIVILWSDHIVKNVSQFKKILNVCEEIVHKHKNKIIFISQKPRFASQNLGWIKFDKLLFRKDNINFNQFESFHYRPNLDAATQFYNSGKYAWNIGYFVTTTSNLWKLYEIYQPEMFAGLVEIQRAVDTINFNKVVEKIYPKFPKISFDNAILEKIDKKCGIVISSELGWSDIGAWEALKEALQKSPDQNVIAGKVLVTDSRDSLIYNYTDQLVATIDVSELLIVNTHDIVLVCHKNSVPKIKKLVEKLAESGNEHLV